MERRHFLEREEITQLLAMGMAMVSRDVLGKLCPKDFHPTMAAVVKRMQEAAANGGAVSEVDTWLECSIGLRRSNGQKLADVVLDRLKSDGAIREAARERRSRPTIEGLMLRMQRLVEERKSATTATNPAS